MDSNASFFFFTKLEKPQYFVVRGRGSIQEVNLFMLDVAFGESVALVCFFVEPDNERDSELFEDRYIVFWGESSHL
jgi:hypothetical protein